MLLQNKIGFGFQSQTLNIIKEFAVKTNFDGRRLYQCAFRLMRYLRGNIKMAKEQRVKDKRGRMFGMPRKQAQAT